MFKSPFIIGVSIKSTVSKQLLLSNNKIAYLANIEAVVDVNIFLKVLAICINNIFTEKSEFSGLQTDSVKLISSAANFELIKEAFYIIYFCEKDYCVDKLLQNDCVRFKIKSLMNGLYSTKQTPVNLQKGALKQYLY